MVEFLPKGLSAAVASVLPTQKREDLIQAIWNAKTDEQLKAALMDSKEWEPVLDRMPPSFIARWERRRGYIERALKHKRGD